MRPLAPSCARTHTHEPHTHTHTQPGGQFNWSGEFHTVVVSFKGERQRVRACGYLPNALLLHHFVLTLLNQSIHHSFHLRQIHTPWATKLKQPVHWHLYTSFIVISILQTSFILWLHYINNKMLFYYLMQAHLQLALCTYLLIKCLNYLLSMLMAWMEFCLPEAIPATVCLCDSFLCCYSGWELSTVLPVGTDH